MDAKKEALCRKVMIACRTELCQLYPALNIAFACLPLLADGQISFGTDGSILHVGENLIAMYAENPVKLRRGFLHTLLHCLYLHIALPDRVDPELWGLACDIRAEKIIEDLAEPRLALEIPGKAEVLSRVESTWDAHRILVLLQNSYFRESAERLKALFAFDDHSLWLPKLPEELKRKWEGALSGGGELGQGTRGTGTKMAEEDIVLLTSSPYDFRRYLQQYTVSREELETDTESFDYIYYTLGMEQYGNLPLLEPLEYKEVWRLDELVIAIDTSGSCSRELVSRFLRETYSILSRQENFFRKMKVVFFQCDCWLQDTAIIESPESWMAYADKVKIKGRGGTDFRPVFRQVEKLRSDGTLKKPKALLYFTDGDGVYPDPTDYETVFVLAGPKKQPHLVPKWAKTLILE